MMGKVGTTLDPNHRAADMITEQQWLTDADYADMVDCIDAQVSERKERLFNVACCRRIWHLFRKESVRQSIEVAEQYADGEGDREQLRAALRTIQSARSGALIGSPPGQALHAAGFVASEYLLPGRFLTASQSPWALACEAEQEERERIMEREGQALRDQLREFFGNPFRPVALDPRWLSANVAALARGIYADRAFDAMPILADALEDAGCANRAVLDHCRGPGPHYRGCWVLDLLLGKE